MIGIYSVVEIDILKFFESWFIVRLGHDSFILIDVAGKIVNKLFLIVGKNIILYIYILFTYIF